jgi:hypothetical protein
MNAESRRNVFLWCSLIDNSILLIWCVGLEAAHSLHYRLTNWWFRVSVERCNMLNLSGVAAFKLAILPFNLVPYVALRIARKVYCGLATASSGCAWLADPTI